MGSFYFLGICKQKAESRKIASDASESYSVVKTASELLQKATLSEAVSEAVSEATIAVQKASEASEAINPTLLDFCNSFSKLTLSDKQKLVELLTGVPCSDPLKAFRIGDKVAGNKPEDSSYNWHGRIVEITTSISCKVDWQEREGMRGGRVISMLFCNLRKI
jgi:putative DNA primase/helicase